MAACFLFYESPAIVYFRRAVIHSTLCLAIGVVSPTDSRAETVLRLVAPQANVFSAAKVDGAVEIRSDEAFRGRLAWRLASSGRTLARGEATVRVRDGQPVRAAMPLRFPSVKDGVVLQTALTIELRREGQTQTAADLA